VKNLLIDLLVGVDLLGELLLRVVDLLGELLLLGREHLGAVNRIRLDVEVVLLDGKLRRPLSAKRRA
jgi:hypothetical protein